MEYGAAREFIGRFWRPLLFEASTGVSSVSIGSRSSGPLDESSGFCIRFGVSEKRTSDQLFAYGVESIDAAIRRLAPEDRFDPADFDVVERGTATTAAGGPRLHPGLSIANAARCYPRENVPEGSIGFFVRESGGNLYLVSCNHVIAQCNRGRAGDAILHPAPTRLRTRYSDEPSLARDHRVAELSTVIPVERDRTGFRTPPENLVDVAMARVTCSGERLRNLHEAVDGRVRILSELSHDSDALSRPELLNRRVLKCGVGTSVTEGEVTDLHQRMRVGWDGGQAVFVDQIGISSTAGDAFAAPGDSGSAIVTDRGELVGLLFAVYSRGSCAINRIDTVMRELQNVSKQRGLSVVTARTPPRQHPGAGGTAHIGP